MDRSILHIDCNKFYASVECLKNPAIRLKPVAVGGSAEERHGIILTKNEIAKHFGIKTGEPITEAKRKCPQLIVIEPDFPLYIKFSNAVRAIIAEYSDYIEPFGLDENWVDITRLGGSSEKAANEIREKIKREVGITVSVGVSWNKTFAKFGSDYKKPDATTVITKENYKEIVWRSPCGNLLYLGPKTEQKLKAYGINTIGELALANSGFISATLGKNGVALQNSARGLDMAEVRRAGESSAVKSIGNSFTTPKDMCTDNDVKLMLTLLADKVSARMRKQSLKGKTVVITVKDSQFVSFTRRCPLLNYTCVSSEIRNAALKLFRENYLWQFPVRSIGVAVCDFGCDSAVQLDFYGHVQKEQKLERLETAVDNIRLRYGEDALKCALLYRESPFVNASSHIDSAYTFRR
ncbi:MAG: DNA polymerase IV [Clostridiales bacterium]|nr:DNA polymerase IV [Clostridiales bacterium]